MKAISSLGTGQYAENAVAAYIYVTGYLLANLTDAFAGSFTGSFTGSDGAILNAHDFAL